MSLAANIKKELKLLIGNFRSTWLQLFLVVEFALVSLIALSSLSLTKSELSNFYIYLLWLIVLYSGSFSLSSSIKEEIDSGMINLYLIRTKLMPELFIAKALSNSLLSFISYLLNLLILSSTQGYSSSVYLSLISTGLLVSLAFGSLATLISALSYQNKFTTIILPLLILPLVCPIFILAINLSIAAIFNGEAVIFSWAFNLLAFLVLLYTVIGINIFEYAFKQTSK